MDWQDKYYQKYYYSTTKCAYCGKDIAGESRLMSPGANRYCSQVCQSKAKQKSQMAVQEPDQELSAVSRREAANNERIMKAMKSEPNYKNIYGDLNPKDEQSVSMERESWTFEGH